MHLLQRNPVVSGLLVTLGLAAAATSPEIATAQTAGRETYYQCPGNVFTNTINAKEAEARHCTAKEAKEPTTIAGPTRPRTSSSSGMNAAPVAGAASARIDPAAQRSRDSDARRILEAELRTEEEGLAAMQKEFNGGQPERQGNERNYQKYADRVVEMKAAIARKESDVAAIRRELAKQPK